MLIIDLFVINAKEILRSFAKKSVEELSQKLLKEFIGGK